MQQIERYGVIALVFLLVTIVAVSFWGDKKSPGFWARLTGRSAAQKEAATATPELTRAELSATERAVENAIPLSAEAEAPVSDPAGMSVAQPLPSESTAVATLAPNAQAPGTIAAPPAQVSPAAASGSSLASSATAAPSPIVAGESSASAADATRVYTVQKGDSLGSIARKTLGQSSRWPEIQALNGGVEPKSLRVGMKLHLPAGAKTTAPSASAKTAADVSKKPADVAKKQGAEKRDSHAKPSSADAAPASTKTYVVRSGDSLRQIAEERLGDGRRWQEIAKLNPGVDPKRLRVGQSLKLPAESTRSLVAQAAVPSSTSNSGKPRVR